MDTSDRRRPQPQDDASLRAGLTPEQTAAIATLEALGWSLEFVRRPLFRDPVPVVVHPDGRHAVLEADGRGVRVSPELVLLDAGRHRGWIPDRKMKYTLVDASRDSWVITIAVGTLPAA